jgi:hypothetical protein
MQTVFAVSAVGFIARRLLGSRRVGRIAAVFEQSFYIDLNGSFLCLAAATAGIDSLTGRCAAATAWDRFDRIIDVGERALADCREIRVGSRLLFSIGRSQTWYPPPPRWTPDSLVRGLEGLSRIEAAGLPTEGLGSFVRGEESDLASSREARYALVPVGELHDWLADAFAHEVGSYGTPPRSVGSLIGLGPGLTPSGDDFLGGAMIAAHALNRPEVAVRLHRNIAPTAERATNSISRAHLDAAAKGAGGARLHAALNSILAGDPDRLPACVEAVGRIGHTSGWDALAGAAMALRAWRAANTAIDMRRHCNLVRREYTDGRGVESA